jgi:zinc protease
MNILLVGDKVKWLDGVKKLGYDVIELDTDGKLVEKKAF